MSCCKALQGSVDNPRVYHFAKLLVDHDVGERKSFSDEEQVADFGKWESTMHDELASLVKNNI